MKLLLHACCGPCAIQCVEALGEEGTRPDLLWYNPNIHPFTEYAARKETLIAYAGEDALKLILRDEYGLRPFIQGVYPRFDARCAFCYRKRLEESAALAARENYDCFSTTLLISPYQKHELIRELGEAAARRHGTVFLYRDFRPRFREGRRLARERGFYMQKYCGCIFSEEERYCPAGSPNP
jgi:predicted adenine nucleotide alpha hydrolase (AANH) superfamily ATPase